ncbi:MAG: TRAM domain-containing protein, partial [Eggerthella lenta]|nr:TRAM domain-containing protein [Eggerthella lenta]
MEETITIERMGYGSEAVGRLESGKAVFVEGGAPGDVAALEIVEDKPTFARARIARLVKPSELRVRPRCEAGAACGGCPWQHLSYDAQLEAKRANVAAALERTAKFGRERAEELVRPCLPSKRQWGYRNKLELGAAMDERGTFQLGFHREGAHDIASPGACPLAHDAIAKAPKALRGALRFAQGSADLGIFRVGVRHSLHTGDLEVALWTSPGSFPRGHIAKTVKSAVKATSIVRVMADPGKARKIKGVETLDGKGCWEEQLGDARYLASAPSFFQVNTAQAEKLVACVIEGLGGRIGEDGPEGLDDLLIADLYAGGGTFSV